MKDECDKLEKEGVICQVDKPTPWCAGLVGVPKAAVGCHLSVGMTKLNQVVLHEKHFMPTVDLVLRLLGSATGFSKLDARAGFHQVNLFESSQEYTTFITTPLVAICTVVWPLVSHRRQRCSSVKCEGFWNVSKTV